MATRRATKACARCRARKKRCDFNYPVCGGCAQAHAECIGFDATSGKEKPRSAISHLEDKIAELEIELQRIRSESSHGNRERINRALESLSSELASAIAEPSGRKPESTLFGSLASKTYIIQSPLPRFNGGEQSSASRTSRETKKSLGSSNISSIPRHVINIMLTNYCEIYMIQYPAVEESALYEACDRIYLGDDKASHFDLFSVAIVLAISANTLIQHNESRALKAAGEFWATVLEHLDYVGRRDQWQRLQALQLLAHYGLLNPQAVDCSSCAQAATRLSIQMGLHRELPLQEQQKFSAQILNRRRRLFWTSFRMDAAMHFVLCRPFQWSHVAITAEFPDSGPSANFAAGAWQLRQLEMEVIMKMYYSSAAEESEVGWFNRIQIRLEELNNRVGNGQVNNINLQLFRLNRPSPRCPNPTHEMRRTAIRTAIMLIKEYANMGRSGKLFYTWYAAHYLVELGATLLDAIIFGLETNQSPMYLVDLDASILGRTVQTFPKLLSKVASNWPALQGQANTLEEIATYALEHISRNKSGIQQHDLSEAKRKLSGFLLFAEDEKIPYTQALSSNHTSNTESSSPVSIAATEDIAVLDPSAHDPDLDAAIEQIPCSSLIAPEPTSMLQLTEPAISELPDSTWLDSESVRFESMLSMEQYYSLYPDPWAVNPSFANSEGMDSDQIFAALMEGVTNSALMQ